MGVTAYFQKMEVEKKSVEGNEGRLVSGCLSFAGGGDCCSFFSLTLGGMVAKKCQGGSIAAKIRMSCVFWLHGGG